jgi:hypothetical protein
MENKKYLDKVVDHMVRNTEIEEYGVFVKHPINNVEKVYHFWFDPLSTYLFNSRNLYKGDVDEDRIHPTIFLRYCVRQFGLTEEETQYVWVNYIRTMVDKHINKKI